MNVVPDLAILAEEEHDLNVVDAELGSEQTLKAQRESNATRLLLYRDEEALRTIENGRVEVLEPVVAVPRLLGLDTPEVHRVIGVHVGIGFGHVGERVVAQKMLVAPTIASLLGEQRRLLGRIIGGGESGRTTCRTSNR